mmetsp:Transcript_8152/g.17661  ORF Transcript_8152/g.17661 Transcript_8152/m.17661 type:complete len:209 (-) Transcript_8152:175-801(-)
MNFLSTCLLAFYALGSLTGSARAAKCKERPDYSGFVQCLEDLGKIEIPNTKCLKHYRNAKEFAKCLKIACWKDPKCGVVATIACAVDFAALGLMECFELDHWWIVEILNGRGYTEEDVQTCCKLKTCCNGAAGYSSCRQLDDGDLCAGLELDWKGVKCGEGECEWDKYCCVGDELSVWLRCDKVSGERPNVSFCCPAYVAALPWVDSC